MNTKHTNWRTEMTTNYTPGPWHYIGDGLTHQQFDIYAPDSAPQQHICTVNNLSVEKLWQRDAAQAEANARLIAAAPDLLRVLMQLEWACTDEGARGMDSLLAAARAAIAKATGGAA